MCALQSWVRFAAAWLPVACMQQPASPILDDADSSLAALRFVDSLDHQHKLNLLVDRGQLQWCQGEHSLDCATVLFLKLDRLMDGTFLLSEVGDWDKRQAQIMPLEYPPGQPYYELAASIVKLADAASVDVSGNASDGFRELMACGNGSAQLAIEANQSFPLPLQHKDGDNSSLAYIKVRGDFSRFDARRLCVSLVESSVRCSSLAFLETCMSAVMKESHVEKFIGFALPRPGFVNEVLLANASVDHRVCLLIPEYSHEPLDLGEVTYHPYPQTRWLGLAEKIGVRTFLNPGWSHILQLVCKDCSDFSRLALRSVKLDEKCRQVALQDLVIQAAAARENQITESDPDIGMRAFKWLETARSSMTSKCTIPDRGPCEGYVDDALDIAGPVGLDALSTRDMRKYRAQKGAVVPFGMNASRRLTTGEKSRFFHQHSVFCFYPNEAYPNGTLVGMAALHMDGHDLQAFVAFVCFFGVVLPLICMITAFLHLNKQERCQQHLQEVRLLLQREQLERELNGEPVASSVVPSSSSTGLLGAMRSVVQGGS